MGNPDWSEVKPGYVSTYGLNTSVGINNGATESIISLSGAGEMISGLITCGDPNGLSTNLIDFIVDGTRFHYHSWTNWLSYFGTYQFSPFIVTNNNPGALLSGIIRPRLPFTQSLLINYTNNGANPIVVSVQYGVGLFP